MGERCKFCYQAIDTHKSNNGQMADLLKVPEGKLIKAFKETEVTKQ